MENKQEQKTGTSQPNAEAAPKPDGAVETKIRIELEFDMASNRLMMRSKAPTVMLQGILQEALSQITQNQVMQRLQAAQLRAKMADIGGRPQ